MTSNKQEILKPCPFCGLHNIEITINKNSILIHTARIGCNTAFCNGNIRRQTTWATEKNAIEAWNTRPTPKTLDERKRLKNIKQ